MREKRNRSEKYQFQILELPRSHDTMWMFDNTDSITNILSPFEYNEEILQLKDELYEEVCKNCKENLSKKQLKILELYMMDLTQQEMADELDINQASINSRLLFLFSKIKKNLENNKKIEILLNQINNLQQEKL